MAHATRGGLTRAMLIAFTLCAGTIHGEKLRPSATGQGESTLTVHVFNYAAADGSTLKQAEHEAAVIFEKAGIETKWVTPADAGLLQHSHIQIWILSSVMAERLQLEENALGLAPGAGPDRKLAYVFYKRVEALAMKHVEYTHAGTARVLGHAIAHEIGHLLLDSQGHSSAGLMREFWELRDLLNASYASLTFSPEQARSIREEVLRRNR